MDAENDVISEKVTVTERVQGRISGGRESATENEFQVQITREGALFCSGAIFNERYILTAAHCVEDAEPEDVTVRAGSRFLGQGMVIPITKIVQHPDYDYPQSNFDIAYMRTLNTLVFDYNLDPFLAPVYIYEADIDELPNELEIDGWGFQGRDGKMQLSEEMREVVLPIISNAECQLYYGAMITKNMLCAYSLRDTSQGACKVM
nr:trypsin-4-like [Maniola hyperantus]